MILKPYKQPKYNKQVAEILKLYLSGKLVFHPQADAAENRYATEQILRIVKGERWPEHYSGAAIDSAVRIIMIIEKARPVRAFEQAYKLPELPQ